ncbi:hypothetical protein X732_30430 [Mesorhizobium sp. L2C066B000]|nr:hypothetical protein X732_30430 [Mesorhizobium sp. L2C066B000]
MRLSRRPKKNGIEYDNAYCQYFSGFEFFQHEAPIDASTMTRWRKRIGPEGLQEMLKASVEAALDSGTARPNSPERITVDTTVQPKAIAHPTDSRLYLKAIQILARQAKRYGIELRQSHARLAKAAAVRAGRYAHARQFRRMRRELKRLRTYLGAGRYAHARQFRRMRRELKRLRTYLGRVFRDISRKIAGNGELEARFARLLGLVERLLAQRPKDKNKLYSMHAPEVVCISKGKARAPYEFGCKVGTRNNNREGLVLAAKSFQGNPYDGHTLAATVDQAAQIGGVEPDRIYVDKGYRGPYEFGCKVGIATTNREGLVLAAKSFEGNPYDGQHARSDGRSGRADWRCRSGPHLRRQGLSRP